MTTIFHEDQYDTWLKEVREELAANELDQGDAFDNYPFRRAYDEYGLTPRAAVDDYMVIMATQGMM